MDDRDLLTAAQWLAIGDNLAYCQTALTNAAKRYFSSRKARQVADEILYQAVSVAIRSYDPTRSEDWEMFLNWKFRFAVLDWIKAQKRKHLQVCLTDLDPKENRKVLDYLEKSEYVNLDLDGPDKSFDKFKELMNNWGLSQEDRRILILRIGYDLGFREIADRLGTNEVAVRRKFDALNWVFYE